MNWFSLLIVAALVGLLLFTIIAVTWAILANLRTGMAFRQNLAQQLHRLRLEKMLKALGIDIGRYLAAVPVTDIDEQMRTCEACGSPARERCEEQLSQGKLEAPDFCPNYPKLKALKEESLKPDGAA